MRGKWLIRPEGRAVAAAAAAGHLDIIDAFLADNRLTGSVRCYALFAAAERGHLAIVERLLADPLVNPGAAHPDAAVSHVGDDGLRVRGRSKGYADANDEALRLAAAGGHVTVVDRLLADPRVSPMSGGVSVPFNVAVRLGHVEVVRRLLGDPRLELGTYPGEALVLAASRGHAAVVELLLADPRFHPVESVPRSCFADVWEQLKLGGSPPQPHRNALAIAAAAECGHLAVVDLLMADPRVDASAHTNTALRRVCSKRHDAVVARLLADTRVRQQPESKDTVLLAACRVGDLALAARLLDHKRKRERVDLCHADYLIPKEAAAAGRLDVLRFLLSPKRLGCALSPAVYAIMADAAGGNVASLDLLLTEYGVHGADVAFECGVAVGVAAQAGHVAALERLLQDPRAAAAPISSLRWPAQGGHAAVVDLLLQKAVVSAEAVRTGITRAAHSGSLDVLCRLLRDPRIAPASLDGWPATVAAEAGHDHLLPALLADEGIRKSVKFEKLLSTVRTAAGVAAVLDAAPPGFDPSQDIQPPLCVVAAAGDAKLLQRLLQACQRRDVSAPALHAAAELAGAAGSGACVDVLLAHWRSSPADKLAHALRGAATKHRMQLLRRLLDDGRISQAAEVPLVQAVEAVLVCAASRGDTELLSRTLAHKHFHRSSGSAAEASALNDAALEAMHLGRLPALDLLLAHPRMNVSPARTWRGPCKKHLIFIRAVEAQKPWSAAVLQRLLAHPSADLCLGDTPCVVQLACQLGAVDCLQALLADSRVQAYLAAAHDRFIVLITHAAGYGRVDALRCLLANPLCNASVPQLGIAPAAEAAYHGHVAAIDTLLSDPRFDASAADETDGTTALHWGAASSGLQLVERLLADSRVFAAQVDSRHLDALDAAIGSKPFKRSSTQKTEVAGDRLAVCRRLLLETNLLHDRLGREDALPDMCRLGIDVAGLGQRAWVRRRAVIVARQRALDSADSDTE